MTHALLLAAVVIWGWTFVATKVCLAHMSPLQLVAGRFVLAAPTLLLVARLRGAPLRLPPRTPLLVAAVAVFSAHYLVQTWALEHTTATNTGWIIAVNPLTIAVLAALTLREPVPRSMRLGIGLASAGIVLLVSRGNLSSLDWLRSLGDWLALVSTFTWAAYTVLTRDLSRALDPAVVALTMTLPLAALGLVFPLLPLRYTPWTELPAEAVAALLFLALFGVALAQWFWQAGIARLGAARAGLYLYVEPLATTALAVPYLGEPFGWVAAGGGLVVLLGVFVGERKVGRG